MTFAFRSLVILISLLAVGLQPARSEVLSKEYKYKLAFLYKFAEYVDVPRLAQPGRIHIVVVGDNPFGSSLSKIASKKPKGRECVPNVCKAAKDIKACDIVFLPRTLLQAEVDACLEHLRDKQVLVVGEDDRVLHNGGVASFAIGADGRIKIHINQNEVKRRNLKIDARLLSICVISRGK